MRPQNSQRVVRRAIGGTEAVMAAAWLMTVWR
jgi:hypothetical protein